MNLKTGGLLVIVAWALSASSDVSAEKVDLSAKALRGVASNVVVGKVAAIYTRAEVKGGWTYTHRVAEVSISSVEKGEGLVKDGLVYARYWTRRWTGRGSPPPSTNGHRGIPKVGESLRIYLARNAYDGFGKTADGGFNVIGANGFERME